MNPSFSSTCQMWRFSIIVKKSPALLTWLLSHHALLILVFSSILSLLRWHSLPLFTQRGCIPRRAELSLASVLTAHPPREHANHAKSGLNRSLCGNDSPSPARAVPWVSAPEHFLHSPILSIPSPAVLHQEHCSVSCSLLPVLPFSNPFFLGW